jgi:Ulp1 family protease
MQLLSNRSVEQNSPTIHYSSKNHATEFQRNGYDCGLFLINSIFEELGLKDAVFELKSDTESRGIAMRKRIASTLRESVKLLPELSNPGSMS